MRTKSTFVAGSPFDRFWAKVNKNGPTIYPELGPCWEWIGTLHPKGYDQFSYRGTTIKAHHFFFLSIPDGLMRCHKCDNRKCVRPDHIFLGTALDNTRDCITKGRNRRGKVGPNQIRGESVPSAKLNEAAVRIILAAPNKKGALKPFREKFGVSKRTISQVRSRKSWKHVIPDP